MLVYIKCFTLTLAGSVNEVFVPKPLPIGVYLVLMLIHSQTQTQQTPNPRYCVFCVSQQSFNVERNNTLGDVK